MPFADNVFEIAVSQALLILMEDNLEDKAIRESIRTLKPGGYIGFLELSWFKKPPKEVVEDISSLMCREYVGKIFTYEGWEGIFNSYGLCNVQP